MKRIVCILMVFVFALCFQLTAYGAAYEVFPVSAETVEDDRAADILSNLNVKLLDAFEGIGEIYCFDVNDSGWIAVGYDSYPRRVFVLNKEGVLQYGFSFFSTGAFDVSLGEDAILVHLIRSNLCVEIASDLTVLQVIEVSNTLENNEYWRAATVRTNRQRGGYIYTLHSDNKIVCTDLSGNETVVFADESVSGVNVIPIVLVTALVVLATVICTALKGKSRMKRKHSETEDGSMS